MRCIAMPPAKAGITYVDVWDGFVDEAGRFLQKGPDFEGQIRQLRTYDGVYFTKPGARKLAHYVEREVTRLLASRSGPIALPIEPATPDANAVPGQPAPRPLAGPILPLVASSVGTDQLLGGPGSRPAAVDALAARTLVKGEPLAAPAGRADDFAWPRREIGREQAKGETPVAATSPSGTVAAPSAQKQLVLPQQPLQPQQKKQFRPAQTEQPRAGPDRSAFAARFLRRLRHRAAPTGAAGQPRRRVHRSAPVCRVRRVTSAARRRCRRAISRDRGCHSEAMRQHRTTVRNCAPENLSRNRDPSRPRTSSGRALTRARNDRSCSSRNSASAAAGGAAGVSSAAPAQIQFRRRPAARRADCPARSSPPPSGRREWCRRCCHRRPWRS